MRLLRTLPLTLGIVFLAPALAVEHVDSRQVISEIAIQKDSEKIWQATIRLREYESDAKNNPKAWNSYKQYRAASESFLGNHGEALAYFDSGKTATQSQENDYEEGWVAQSASDYILARSHDRKIVMVNERHHAAPDRLLTLSLLPGLYDQGYRYLAVEAAFSGDEDLNSRGYVTANSGIYTSEVVFAELINFALELGFEVIPYEIEPGQRVQDSGLTSQQLRDRSQAQNITARIFDLDPEAKVIVHAGNAHIWEEERGNWIPMALYLTEATGFDPLTIDQTRLSERSERKFEHATYRRVAEEGLLTDYPVVFLDSDGQLVHIGGKEVDIRVFGPQTKYEFGRPTWMSILGRRKHQRVEVPECVDRTCFVTVSKVGQADSAIPRDIAECRQCNEVTLFAPRKEAVMIRIFSADGELIRSMNSVDHKTAESYRN